MSGLDEMDKLWILEYQEFHVEDYITCYRGLRARDKETAEELGKLWVGYLNLEYNNSDDVDLPDYIFITVTEPGVDASLFIISRKVLRDADGLVKKWEAGELDVD